MQRKFSALPSILFVTFVIAAFTGRFGVHAQAQSATFSNANLCAIGQFGPEPCSQTQLVTVNVTTTATLSTTKVMTGGQSNLDFTLADGSGSCSGDLTPGSTCTVNVKFAPLQAGARIGAVQLADASGNILERHSCAGPEPARKSASDRLTRSPFPDSEATPWE